MTFFLDFLVQSVPPKQGMSKMRKGTDVRRN
jgi:hypothetical protein